MTDAAKQTSKKYEKRPSPPYHADAFKGKTLVGNDGRNYRSVANRAGIYQWKVLDTRPDIADILNKLEDGTLAGRGNPQKAMSFFPAEEFSEFIAARIRNKQFEAIGAFPVTDRVTVECGLALSLKSMKGKISHYPAVPGKWTVYHLGPKQHWNKDGGIPEQQGSVLALSERQNIKKLGSLRWQAQPVGVNSDIGVYAAEYFGNDAMIDPKLRERTNNKRANSFVKGSGWADIIAKLFFTDNFKKNYYMLSHGAVFQAPEMRGRLALLGTENKSRKLAAVFIVSLG